MAESDSSGTNREKVVRSVMTRPRQAVVPVGNYTPGGVQANAVSRFHVTIDQVTNAVFSEVSGLQIETELFEYQEGGNNGFVYKLPAMTKAGNVTLKRGVAVDNALLKWYMRIASGIMDLREVSISMYRTNAVSPNSKQVATKPIITWTFNAAFPCKWVGPQLAAGTDTVAIETIEIAHMGEIKIS